ncbi:tumor necrosis factor ligand superfamily member 14-like [Cheilinus undulatus]|uniref:tumor necrosis factor ligand superfamily member 14-like n=1 Tax=Cheilinus undulatus TaxID=241271 RepID=UPI001BD37006|nr:tumor necrosis factor ligand superfamily member 14-like [Cheilinus undulatus]XP_041640381.1 tumor necrosis factor ligand superfamily member 14-like [Cheilinus undulatus]XP_041640382.1 tumor necrosis factor ligand superfamily member 14-like [Cheilinus undulatus]
MAEACVASNPQVFVVDSQASYISVPMGKKQRWERSGQNLLLLLVGLLMFGLVVQGCLIYNLYKKTEAFSHHMSHPFSQNLSGPILSSLKGGITLSQVGHKGSNDTSKVGAPAQEVQQRPFAHLMGANSILDEDNVVQWINDGGETVTRNMSYRDGRLLVEKEGYYYLYSKVTLDAEDCSFFQHEVFKDTKAYGKPIQLMKSKRIHCWTPRSSDETSLDETPPHGEELWNSFLAGIFHLEEGDKVFVRLDSKEKKLQATADNLLGAFMIST